MSEHEEALGRFAAFVEKTAPEYFTDHAEFRDALARQGIYPVIYWGDREADMLEEGDGVDGD